MALKRKNSGFSLMELIVSIAILATFAAIVVPSFVSSMHGTRIKKDETKFETVCTAFKVALGEPEVQKEAALVGGGNKLTAAFKIDDNGLLDFSQGQLVGVSTETFKKTKLWLNSYQSIGVTYKTESTDFHGQYIVFILTPKTEITTAKCEYRIVESYP